MSRILGVILAGGAMGWAGACVELSSITPAGGSTTNAGQGGDASDDSDGGAGSGELPDASLSVSNRNPTVGEEVRLTCSVTGGDGTSVTFAFQPADARLIVDVQSGGAVLIVDATDVGSELRYTCTATNSTGTSATSNPVSIIPGA